MSGSSVSNSHDQSNLWVRERMAPTERPLKSPLSMKNLDSASVATSKAADSVGFGASFGNKKELKQAAKSRRKWKRPKDKPKRPLSAYNLFFQHEREKIIASTATPVMPVSSPETQAKKRRRRHRKTHGKISFADLAKTIGVKWKELDTVSKAVFESRARAEKARYKRELAAWNKSREAKSIGDKDLVNQISAPPHKPFARGLQQSRAVVLNNSSMHHLKPSHQVFPKMSSGQESISYSPFSQRETISPLPQENMSHSTVNSNHTSLESLRPLSSLLFSGSPLVKDPKFNATAHEECLEITRQTIEMAKATLSMPVPSNLTSFIPMKSKSTCSNMGVADNDGGFLKIDSSALGSSVMEPARLCHQEATCTPDIIDSAFWETEDKQITCRRDFLNSPRNSLGSFWDVDFGPTAGDLEPAV